MKLVSFHLPSDHWASVKALRLTVFVDEMDVPPELEIDEDDQLALHLAFIEKGEALATLRILENEQSAKIGRVAVAQSYRRQGVGTALMQEAITYCQTHNMPTISLGAQTYITNFYASFGFQKRGETFLDAGIPHIEMTLHA